MIKLFTTFFCFLFITHILCSQNIGKLYIDPTKTHGGTMSDWFDEIEYIPLETTKESLFGDMYFFLPTPSSFLVFDNDTRSILFFNLGGKFIKKIHVNNNIYPSISFDKINKKIYILMQDYITGKTKMEVYLENGERVSKTESKKETERLGDMISIGGEYFASFSECHLDNNKATDSSEYLLRIYRNDSLIKTFCPVNPVKDYPFCKLTGYLPTPLFVENGFFYCVKPLDHLIYQVNKDTMRQIGQFVFPANRTVPTSIINSNNRQMVDSFQRTFTKNFNIILGVRNTFFNGNKLFFKIDQPGYVTSYGASHSNEQYNFIIDTISKKLYSLERMSPDFISHYLPIFDRRSSITGLSTNGRFFYSYISSLKMFESKEKNKHRNPQYPPVLQEYFRTQNRKSNPVIIRMKLKE